MAVPSVTANLTTINSCDDATGLSGDTFVSDPDVKIEGTNSQSWASTNNGRNEVVISVGSVALGTEHIRLWFNSTIASAYVATTGIQLDVVHGGGTATWNVDPTDEYVGGWLNIVIYGGSTPDAGVAVGANLVTAINIVQNTGSKPRNTINTWIDYVRYGDGLICTGGTSVDPINLLGIAAVDQLNGYGIVQNINGVAFLSGSVQIGNGATATYARDDNNVIVFTNSNVSSTLYKLDYQGSGCEVELLNTVIKTGGPLFDMLFNDANLLNATLDGCAITGADQSLFKAGQSITSSSWNQSGTVEPSTATFTNIVIKNSTASGAGTGSVLIPFVNNANFLTFSGNDRDVLLNEAGSYSGESFTHDGTSNFDIAYNNVSNSTFNVPPTGNTQQARTVNDNTGTMTVTNLKTKTFTGLPENAEIRILQGSFTLSQQQNVVGGVYNYDYTPTGAPALVRMTSPGKVLENINIVLDSNDQSFQATVSNDPSYLS